MDVRRMDAGMQPKRRRKDRSKPNPPDNLAAGKEDARAFADSLPTMPGLVLEERDDALEIQSPHNDKTLWELQLVQAFGTRSRALLNVFLMQLGRLCPKDWDEDRREWRTDETQWNALLALVADWRPENSAQAALAAQMAATHLMTMKLSEQALNRGHMVMPLDAALASKLTRTFAIQCETMLALKGQSRTTKQSIHITKETHQHVHQHIHEGGGGENGDRPHQARTATASECPALPSQVQIDRQPLPSPRGEGQEGLSQARRGETFRRSEGQG